MHVPVYRWPAETGEACGRRALGVLPDLLCHLLALGHITSGVEVKKQWAELDPCSDRTGSRLLSINANSQKRKKRETTQINQLFLAATGPLCFEPEIHIFFIIISCL